MLLLPILIPLICGLALLFFSPKNLKTYSFTVLVISIILVFALPFFQKDSLTFGYFPLGIELTLQIDEISIFFSFIFSIVWFVVLYYSFDYLSHDDEKRRFFAFFIALFGILIGVSYAKNLITMYMFFEMVSLLSITLIAHERTTDSMKACKKYIFYSLGGAFIGLICIFYFYSLDVSRSFTAGGIENIAKTPYTLFFVALSIIGFGCKSGLFPLHGWLKTAHPIAPAPASAILSGITTKVGIIAIIRIAYFVVGPDLIKGTIAQDIILCVSLFTIFLGSMLAYKENVLKTRLAYSTVSQLSYIIFSLFIFNKIAFIGAMLHVLAHAFSKTSLFLCAGTIIHETGIKTVDKLTGLGGKLKSTFILFTISGLSLVGVPFTSGFVSKWYIATGALTNTKFGFIGVCIIMISALLTAGYLLTITAKAMFPISTDMKFSPLYTKKSMTSPVLSVLIIALGIYPLPIINFLSRIADKIL